MRENDVAQSAIQLANSGYTTFTATRPSTRTALPRPSVLQGTGSRVAAPSPLHNTDPHRYDKQKNRTSVRLLAIVNGRTDEI